MRILYLPLIIFIFSLLFFAILPRQIFAASASISTSPAGTYTLPAGQSTVNIDVTASFTTDATPYVGTICWGGTVATSSGTTFGQTLNYSTGPVGPGTYSFTLSVSSSSNCSNPWTNPVVVTVNPPPPPPPPSGTISYSPDQCSNINNNGTFYCATISWGTANVSDAFVYARRNPDSTTSCSSKGGENYVLFAALSSGSADAGFLIDPNGYILDLCSGTTLLASTPTLYGAPPPVGTISRNVSGSNVALSWSPTIRTINYEIDVRNDGIDISTGCDGISGCPSTSYSFTCVPGSSFYYSVYSHNVRYTGFSGTGGPFICNDFSLSNSGNITLTQGQNGSNTISVILIAEINQTVNLSISGLPPASTALSTYSCSNPTCAPTTLISNTTELPVGTYSVTVTGVSGNLTRTTNFNVTVSSPPPPPVNVSCSAIPPNQNLNQDVLWTANASGDNGSYSYSWSGTAITGATNTTNPGNVSNFSKNYSSGGGYTATVTATSGSQASNSCSVTINAPAWIQTTGGDVHSNERISAPGGP